MVKADKHDNLKSTQIKQKMIGLYSTTEILVDWNSTFSSTNQLVDGGKKSALYLWINHITTECNLPGSVTVCVHQSIFFFLLQGSTLQKKDVYTLSLVCILAFSWSFQPHLSIFIIWVCSAVTMDRSEKKLVSKPWVQIICLRSRMNLYTQLSLLNFGVGDLDELLLWSQSNK